MSAVYISVLKVTKVKYSKVRVLSYTVKHQFAYPRVSSKFKLTKARAAVDDRLHAYLDRAVG